MYLSTVVVVDQSNFRFHPMKLAAALCLLVCQRYNLTFNTSMVYWSSYDVAQLGDARMYVLELWERSYENGLHGRPSEAHKKYSDPRRFAVSMVEPYL